MEEITKSQDDNRRMKGRFIEFMSTREIVIACVNEHPDWTYREIASVAKITRQ
jgi:transcription initiation factor TFIIIB Brf1 subunit/transcription initiation factor TFIIB